MFRCVSSYLLSAVSRSASHEVEMYLFFPLCRHPVWPDGGSVSSELDMYLLGMYLYALLCRHLLSFDPAVRRTASCEVEMYSPPSYFRLILTFCYCFYGFFRELDIASGRSPDRNKADPFHALTRWAKLYDFAPDIQDAMELRALGPHAIFVKVIYTLGSRRIFSSDLALGGLHEFSCQNVADIQEGKSEKVSRTVSASPPMLDMTVTSTSGVIAPPPEVPVRNVLPLATVVSIIDAITISTGTPFVVPLAPGIERPVMQAQDFLTCQLLRSREFLPSFRLSASLPAPTLPRDAAKDSSPSFSLHRVQVGHSQDGPGEDSSFSGSLLSPRFFFQPLRGNTSPLAGEALLQPPADACVVSGLGDPNTAAWCEQYPGSESPWSLPGCATVQALLSAGTLRCFRLGQL